MADYINRDSVIELSREYYSQGLKEKAVPVTAIRNIPSADVVEVVRCKDCFYGRIYGNSNSYYCVLTMACHGDNFFCANGARMDGE